MPAITSPTSTARLQAEHSSLLRQLADLESTWNRLDQRGDPQAFVEAGRIAAQIVQCRTHAGALAAELARQREAGELIARLSEALSSVEHEGTALTRRITETATGPTQDDLEHAWRLESHRASLAVALARAQGRPAPRVGRALGAVVDYYATLSRHVERDAERIHRSRPVGPPPVWQGDLDQLSRLTSGAAQEQQV